MIAEKQLQQRDVLPSSIARHLRRRIALYKATNWAKKQGEKNGRRYRKNRGKAG